MASPGDHPTDTELSRFASGELPGDAAAKIREHSSRCAKCYARIARAIPDTVQQDIGAGATVPGRPSPAVRAPPPEEPRQPKKGDSIGRYQLVSEIAQGGMGVVYLAYDPELDRQVALKLLRADAFRHRDAANGRARLLREAQAMARLNHPHVVPVHDAAIIGEQVYLVMAFVDGENIRAWLGQQARSWREIVDVFLQAGRGLEAAHAMGLIHRDFKPDNVLVDKQGQAYVTDFGLARALVSSSEPPSDSLLKRVLTRKGQVAGTPGYMSPEQALGQPTDARSDQFSFSISLHKALTGKLSPSTRSSPAAVPDVPAWIKQAVARGMAQRPADRFPTMGDLLAALESRPALVSARRVPLAAVCVLALLAAAAGAFALYQRRTDVCYAPERRLANIWNDQDREAIRSAVVASGAGGDLAWANVEKTFDRFSGEWVAAHSDACRATREQHAQPESALLLRLECLDSQRADLRAALSFLKQAKPLTPGAAIGTASNLPSPSDCADARTLSLIAPPPSNVRSRLNELRVRLAEARALRNAGSNAEAAEELERLAAEAHALAYPPFEAEVLTLLGRAQVANNQLDAALQTQKQALDLAETLHLDRVSVDAASAIVFVLARQHRPAAEIDGWAEQAHIALQRVSQSKWANFRYELSRGSADLSLGRGTSAVEHDERALQLAKELSNDTGELAMLNNLANALESIGAYDEMVDKYRQAIDGSARLFGPQSDDARMYWSNLGEGLADLGRLDDAEAAESHVGNGSDRWSQTAEAVRARIRAEEGRTDEAMHLANQVVADLAQAPDLDSRRFAAEAYLLVHQPALALAQYEAMIKLLKIDPVSPDWVPYLRIGGAAFLATGKPDKALPLLEKALALSAAHPLYPGWAAEIRFRLAQALEETGGDTARAAALVQQAREELVPLANKRQLLAELEAWRTTLRPAPRGRRRSR